MSPLQYYSRDHITKVFTLKANAIARVQHGLVFSSRNECTDRLFEALLDYLSKAYLLTTDDFKSEVQGLIEGVKKWKIETQSKGGAK